MPKRFNLTAIGIPEESRGVIEEALRGVGVDVSAISFHGDQAAGERRSMQQVALVRLGQLVLGNASLGFVFSEASKVIGEILETDCVEIYKRVNERLLLVGGGGEKCGVIGESVAKSGRGSQAGYTLETLQLVIVDDANAEVRFHAAHAGMTSGVSVVMESDIGVWGVLAAHSRERRSFTDGDVDFLRALASTLGQAVARRSAEVELKIRAAQQGAIAELGQRLLTSDVDHQVFERACELTMEGLGVEFSLFFETFDDGQTIKWRGGEDWAENPATRPRIATSHVGYTIRSNEPIVVEDYRLETRFDTSVFLPYGVRSGLAVPITGPHRKYGALTAQTRAAKRFDAGDVHFMQSIANLLADAMERQTVRHALVESEQRYRSVVEGASEIIYTVSTTGLITSLNPAFEFVTGWRVEQWLGKPLIGLVDPSQRGYVQSLFGSILTEPRYIKLEVAVIGANGKPILLEVSSSPKVVDGRVLELYGFAHDVTDRRRLEAEWRRTSRELQLLLESTDEGFYAVNAEGRCTLINRSAAKILGATADELLNADLLSLVHCAVDGSPLPAEKSPVQNVIATGRSYSSRDDRFRRMDGSIFPVEYTASPIIDDGVVKGAVVTFNDITQHRRLEAKLEQANRLSSLGRLAATVAHEFNNVLMGIAPFVDLLKRESLPDRTAGAVDQISRSVMRGKRITEDILRFTQPAEPALTPIDLCSWLESVVPEARSLIGTRYSIGLRCQDQVRVLGDASQLHQSIINLILNARDAMPDGGRIVMQVGRDAPDAKYASAVQHPERYAHVVVEDSGVGMSADTLNHIFEPLFTTKKSGTGLGLSVARHVISRHGGEIFAESAVGAGTKFHLFIPLSKELLAAERVTDSTSPGGKRAYQRILIVEDERPVAAGLSALFEMEGIEVDVVENGRDVLPAIERMKPDAVILDIGLPDMEGTVVFAQIAELHPLLPVVFSTGHGDASKLEPYLAKPHVAFLLKPYEIGTLLDTLDRVVG